LRAIFLSKGRKSFIDTQTDAEVDLTEVNYIPQDGEGKGNPQVAYTRLEVPEVVPGKMCEFYFTVSKSGKDKLIGIIPQ